jgi:hypothetical protein
MQVVRSVDRGERLAIPPTCPPDYAKLINECWASDPVARPPFSSILVTLERMRNEYLAQKAQEATGASTPQTQDNNGKNETTAAKEAGNKDTATPPPQGHPDGLSPMSITPKNLHPPPPVSPISPTPPTPSANTTPPQSPAPPAETPLLSSPTATVQDARLIEDTSFT